MLDPRTLSGAILALGGTMALCSALGDIDVSPSIKPWRASGLSPVAALAWSETRCDSHLNLVAGTPRLQAEDLLQMTARLDALEAERGRGTACETAISVATSVATQGEGEAADANGDAGHDANGRNLVASVK